MTNQDKLNFKEKYQNNPAAFVEDFCDIKLHSWQKAFLKANYAKDKIISYINPYRNGKEMLFKGQLEYMKIMEMDFEVWTKDGIEIYEKGKLIKVIKHKNN